MSKVVAEVNIEVRGMVVVGLTKKDIEKIVENGGDYNHYISNVKYDIDDVSLSDGGRQRVLFRRCKRCDFTVSKHKPTIKRN